jgi:uncharacterized membrane protein (DUF485 family)
MRKESAGTKKSISYPIQETEMQITSPSTAHFQSDSATLRSIAQRRQRVALTLTVLMLAVYFSFVLSIAYFKQALSVQLIPGLTGAILAGLTAVAFALALTVGYVVWINRVHDKAVFELTKGNG